MPETHDLVVIEIRGEKAVITLEELRNLFVSLQTAATQTGEMVDASMSALVAPIQQIAQSTGIAVQELRLLRTELASMAGVAGGPAAAAAGIQQIGVAAQQTRAAIVPGYAPTGTQMVSGRMPQDIASVEAYRAGLEKVAPAAEKVAEASDKGDKATGRWNASFSRHIAWFVQGTIIYYSLMTVMQAVAGTIEGMVEGLLTYDTAMGQMRYITSETTGELDTLADAARGIGVTFGQLPTEVLPGLIEITQATKDLNEQLIYSRDAARWAFMSGQEYGEGLENLIAIERVWGMEANEGQRVLDVVATSYRSAMVPMDEMINALQEGGKIAESVGLSFEEYAAVIAAVGEYSDLSAAQVTTLMERISARPFQPDLARRFQKEFGFLNIQLFEPGTAQTQRRELSDILDDLAANWDRLTASQRQSVAEVFASSRQASEFLTLMEAWQKVPEYVDEYNDSLGESNKLIDEQMGTIQKQKEMAIAAWTDMRTELGLYIADLLGLADIYRQLGIGFAASAARRREERGLGPEPPTESELLRGQLQQEQEHLAALRGERGVEERRAAEARYAGIGPGIPTEEMIKATEARIAELQRRLAAVTPPTETGVGTARHPMGEEWARQEGRQQRQEIYTEEQAFQDRMAELRGGEYIPNVDAWLAGIESVNNALDLSELSQEQIRQAQADSAAMAWEIYEAYIAEAEELQGSALTMEQKRAIADATVEKWAEMVILIRNARGELEIVTGLEAAFLDDTTEALQAEKARFDIQRLGRVQPEQFGQLQQGAWQWQAYLGTVPGYDEEARTFYVVLADNVARPIVTTSTALRYAIEDLTEVEKRQLEGMWNLPAGVTAYVPITSLFYQQQQAAAGPPGGGTMTGPPWTGGRIDTTPVTMAVSSLAWNLDAAGIAAATFSSALLMAQEQVAQASILTPERRGAVEQAFEYYTRSSILTPERRAEVEQAFQQNPWAQTPVNINLTSQLYLNQTLLATALQQVLGANLSNSARGYGTRAGGNAPPVMM